ncbi:MAG TPA: acyl-CoA dehydrogenase family protein [Acidimicrobiia bacterium]
MGPSFVPTEEQELLRETARRFLEQKCPPSSVRALMESDEGFDPSIWKEIADLGWQGIAIPEAYGGAGSTMLEQAVLMEEMGKVLFPGPYLASAVLAANTIMLAGSEEQKRDLLPEIASGERIVTVAFAEPEGLWDASGVQLEALRAGGEFVLTGTKMFVLDGHIADVVIVAARTGKGETAEGISLFLVPGEADGLTRRRLETMDMTRKQAELSLESVRLPRSALLGEEGKGWEPLETAIRVAVVALAAEQVGGAQKCLDMSVEYAKVRVQFGRPIGSFQAIKHKCADMLVQVESARSAASYAAWAAASAPEELREAAPVAKSYCSEAFFFCAAENIQVHGGIGFTWEHDAHLYFKRAKSSELLFGDPVFWRRQLADELGI